MEKGKHIRDLLSPENKGGQIYFIGIGGIGMSALARYFKFQGKTVSGYDKTETKLTKDLTREGIEVHYSEDLAIAPKNPDVVVYTPAIPKTHNELRYYSDNDFPILKRSDILGIITENSFNICIAGTHGKTTVSSMVAHILRDSAYGCNAFLGGILVNYNTNFWSSERNVCVVEADEYDRSFLKLTPDVAVITAMDADHLDIYGDENQMQQAFIDFTNKIKVEGTLYYKYGLEKANDFNVIQKFSYHLNNPAAAVYAKDIKVENGSYTFDISIKKEVIQNFKLNMGGLHNVENAIVAIAIAKQLGIRDRKIQDAVQSFQGVKRRFEYIVKERIVFIDDYAHHPEELRALINGVRSLFGKKKCLVIFQPHLFTRTKDLADEFAQVLDLADEVVLLPIYAARELPIDGVTSKMITRKMKKNSVILNKEDLLSTLPGMIKSKVVEIIVTAGAGDIDTLIPGIRQIIEKEIK